MIGLFSLYVLDEMFGHERRGHVTSCYLGVPFSACRLSCRIKDVMTDWLGVEDRVAPGLRVFWNHELVTTHLKLLHKVAVQVQPRDQP